MSDEPQSQGRRASLTEIAFTRWEWRFYRFLGRIRKNVFCRIGIHGPRFAPDNGGSANFCMYGCSKVFNPNAFQLWLIALRWGEVVQVDAVNEAHARKLVIFGGPFRYGAAVKVHPSHILGIRRANERTVGA